jgi:hypothetical protein
LYFFSPEFYPGFHVFSAPWETTSALLASINKAKGYGLKLPTTYKGPNIVYMPTITPSGKVSLATFDSKLSPPDTYPAFPLPVAGASCKQQTSAILGRRG